MDAVKVTVTFEPTGRSVRVAAGTTVLEAAASVGLRIDAPCGGAGTCGKCRVRFTTHAPAANDAEGKTISAADRDAGWRLACQAKVDRDVTVAIPETSLFAEQIQILTETTELEEAGAAEPSQSACPIPLDPDEPNLAVAFDVGTTTRVGELIELPAGTPLAVAAAINPQVSFGDDVVSRIGHACESPEALAELRDAVREALGKLIDELCVKGSRQRTHVRAVGFSGNTTMQHLLCGLDVTNLAHLPFEPARRESLCVPAAELGIELAPDARAYVMPVIGGFVGGDTVSGILSTSIARAKQPTVMIDIGTNGEIVLAAEGKLLASSAAAGPAFEGARISCGMRAAAGAIEKVQVVPGRGLDFSVIGGGKPIGICGSALVDVAAEMLRCGAMDATGRIVGPEELNGDECGLAARLRADDEGQAEFLLAAGAESGPDVTIRQRDIRELQLATGALRAGVAILLKQAGVEPDEIGEVLIAGGFGSFIRRDNAQRIGLIPQNIAPEKVRYVGNVSLHGAKWALVSAAARAEAERLADQARHVELSNDMDFQMAFADSMMFPEK